MVSRESVTTTSLDFTNPLYLHPSDGTHTIAIFKLTGFGNYRTWRKLLEIAISSKRKLGFVTGALSRPIEHSVKAELWDTSIQHEESQREVLRPVKLEVETASMFSKTSEITCDVSEITHKCFEITGYLKWHPKSRKQQKNNGDLASTKSRWAKRNSKTETKKFSGISTASSFVLSETDDELEHIFGGMVTSCNASLGANVWIIDLGASDHMTFNVDAMRNSVVLNDVPSINLPNGDVS
uniref:Retrotransposon Copia-like N-terminal domain-containing protein n=1 Tax=Chenopodium quinoa TaxID=63459 RepID=A0A803N2R4_CHEQI